MAEPCSICSRHVLHSVTPAWNPADRNSVTVYRRQGNEMVRGPVDLDFPIYPGDTVVISERWF